MEILNRVARHNYFIDDEIEAGIALTGTEIKAIREGNCNIKDSYAIVRNREVILLNMFIGEYKQGNIFNHKSTRNRKLLLHKREILKLNDKIRLEGYTLIPLKVYFNNNLYIEIYYYFFNFSILCNCFFSSPSRWILSPACSTMEIP